MRPRLWTCICRPATAVPALSAATPHRKTDPPSLAQFAGKSTIETNNRVAFVRLLFTRGESRVYSTLFSIEVIGRAAGGKGDKGKVQLKQESKYVQMQ
jgi:hypothetical protein